MIGYWDALDAGRDDMVFLMPVMTLMITMILTLVLVGDHGLRFPVPTSVFPDA